MDVRMRVFFVSGCVCEYGYGVEWRAADQPIDLREEVVRNTLEETLKGA